MVPQSPRFFFRVLIPVWIFSTAKMLMMMPARMQMLITNMTAPKTVWSAWAAISPTEP